MKKKKGKNKKKYLYGKKEFFFNLFSLIIVIIIGIYFGSRSIYYYSKQNTTIKLEKQTLNGMITSNNKVVTTGDGLYRDSDGYYFRGNVGNNYVKYGNRLFRVIDIDLDNRVKVVSDDLVASFMWGEDSSYEKSNLKYWLNKSTLEYSGVYYDTLPNPNKFLTKTKYSENILKKDKVKITSKVEEDFITTLTIDDYVRANGKNSYLNNKKIYYLLGLDEEKSNLYVDDDGSIQEGDNLDGYGVRAVFTFKANINVLSGNGSYEDPYVINQENDVNYIDSYVRLGNDIYKVYQEDVTGILKLYGTDYAKDSKGVYLTREYSKENSLFNLTDKNNIAYFLNTKYLQSLPYNKYLVDNYFYTGEVSLENGYKYSNIFSSSVICKVGMLNIFDYVSNNYLDDFFNMNTTSTVGSMQYSKFASGLLEEADVDLKKHIVLVISINKSSIIGGNGTLNEPYVVE